MSSDKVLNRKEVPKEMTWDLETIYATPEAWEKDFAAIPALVDKFMAFKGKLADSAASLREAIETEDNMERLDYSVKYIPYLYAIKNE
jgi:oligoendopeptidase F